MLAVVAAATCFATYNSVQYLAWGIEQEHGKVWGADRQLLESGGQQALTLKQPAPKAAGVCTLQSKLSATETGSA